MTRYEYQRVIFNSVIPYPERLLYAYLRSCVDYTTGVVGSAGRKRVSYQAIAEALEFVPVRGSKTLPERYGRNRIYKLLAALERRGLVVPLSKERSSAGRRKTLLLFMPLVVGGSVRPQEEGDKEGDKEGVVVDSGIVQYSQVVTPLFGRKNAHEGDEEGDEEGDTSVNTLSLYNYKYYEPDNADWGWMRYQFGSGNGRLPVDVALETEKFNLRRRSSAGYDLGQQREDWRTWMIRAVQYQRGRQ